MDHHRLIHQPRIKQIDLWTAIIRIRDDPVCTKQFACMARQGKGGSMPL